MNRIVPKAVTRLIESFEKLPGIGPKTAQRLVFYMLHVPQPELEKFAENVRGLKANTVLCGSCKNVSEHDPCDICASPTRDRHIICVVEQPTDVLSVERTNRYHGQYHVLHGVIDPLNSIGPDEIFIDDLLTRVLSPDTAVTEVILATNPNMEGEATAMYIQKQIASRSNGKAVTVSRIAHGLPVGADIEYVDEVTLTRALEGRRDY